MSIITKLKLDRFDEMVILNEPNHYHLLANQPTQLTTEHEAVFAYVFTIEEMAEVTEQVMRDQHIKEGGSLFFAYPKKGNKCYDQHIHRDSIFPALKVDDDGYINETDLKFSRMVSMDDVFTVIEIRRKKKMKTKVKSSAASQRVADYEELVSYVEKLLQGYPNELTFYQGLTPGYRSDWARFIYSAKQEKTRKKRKEQMIECLAAGFKSIDLYKLNKKS
ncbi:YdeI/OmpD-associated family protein [Bacillus sp. JCM 19034]|uniref:YdeI/OmpD-associated family protein n=1 Tax=Bacillus sp. JCM 19034 TaxID=1481928 RepID=UPI0007837178|nr:YdeI/OmpD-associated family protein [Bacillus sp. JCM 19034]